MWLRGENVSLTVLHNPYQPLLCWQSQVKSIRNVPMQRHSKIYQRVFHGVWFYRYLKVSCCKKSLFWNWMYMHVPVCQHWVWQQEHTHLSTLQPLCSTLHHPTTQWTSTLSSDTTSALCRWKKRHNTRHTLPLGSARRHRFAEITREEDRGPRKNCPQKTVGKKGIGGALIWSFEWRG